MPQIKGNQIPTAMELFKKASIPVELVDVEPSTLNYSQKQVDKSKVMAIIKDMRGGKSMNPIIISNDDFIVDGHHRCIAHKYLFQPVKCLKVGLDRDKAIEAYSKIEEFLNV